MNANALSPTDFLEMTPMRAILGIPSEVLDEAMAQAWKLYQAGRYHDAEILCKGLLAADHRYWWAYSLYAAVLRKQGRLREALIQTEAGLRYEPGQPKLLAMRADIARTLIAWRSKMSSAQTEANPGPAQTEAR